MLRNITVVLSVVVSSLVSVQVNAAVYVPPLMIDPTAATFSVSAFSGTSGIIQSINANGLAVSPTVNTGNAVPGVYPTHNNTGHPSGSAMTSTQTFSMTFDLGAVYDLNQTASMHLWNYNESGAGLGRGIRTASIFYTSTGTSIGTASGWVSAASGVNFAMATGLTSYTGSDYSYLNGLTARFIRFDVTANYSNILAGAGNFTGISEIRFISAEVIPPAPEPSTAVLLGLGTIGLVARRRRQA